MSLPWIRVDAQMFTHPKIARLRDARKDRLIVTHLAAMMWSGHHATGGHIPTYALGMVQAQRKDANALVEAGLWDPDLDGDGWHIHDWADYNPTADAIQQMRERQRAKALKRWEK